MRTRALALLVTCSVGWVLARRAAAVREPVAPLSCPRVVSVVEAHGERLACPEDPALASCGAVGPGLRHRGCEPQGPVRGALLRIHHQPIDVNRASADDLRALPGVGAKTALALLEGRRDRPYCGARDLERAPRIGPKKAVALARSVMFARELCGGGGGE